MEFRLHLGIFLSVLHLVALAVNHGMKPFHAVLISLPILTSAGQFAGLTVILAGSSLVEMALTQLVINMRYALMSLSLSQKFARSVHTGHRLAIAYGITDEIPCGKQKRKSGSVVHVWIDFPSGGWGRYRTLGGAVAAPCQESSEAIGVALYGMFVAIVIPPAKKEKNVCIVVITALILCWILLSASAL